MKTYMQCLTPGIFSQSYFNKLKLLASNKEVVIMNDSFALYHLRRVNKFIIFINWATFLFTFAFTIASFGTTLFTIDVVAAMLFFINHWSRQMTNNAREFRASKKHG